MSSTSTFEVTQEMVDTFYEQGFVRINQVFTPQEMDEIDAAFERLYATAEKIAQPREGAHVSHGGSKFTYGKDNDYVRHIAYCGNVEPVLLKFGRDERLLAIASAILGSREVDQLINQAHYKRPGSGVAFDWHQDIMHRGITRGAFQDVDGKGSYVQIALAVDDATENNGPLEFIPGSNKLGFLGEKPGEKADTTGRVAPLIKRGDVAAFGPYTIHGSVANLSDKSRRVFINGFAYPGANLRTFDFPHAGERLTCPQR